MEDATGTGEVNMDVLLEELRFPSPSPAPQVLKKTGDVTCPWMDDRGVRKRSFCYLEVGEDTSSATHSSQLG